MKETSFWIIKLYEKKRFLLDVVKVHLAIFLLHIYKDKIFGATVPEYQVQ